MKGCLCRDLGLPPDSVELLQDSRILGDFERTALAADTVWTLVVSGYDDRDVDEMMRRNLHGLFGMKFCGQSLPAAWLFSACEHGRLEMAHSILASAGNVD